MTLFVLADVDYDECNILGIFDTPEAAMRHALHHSLMGSCLWLEEYALNTPGRTNAWTRGKYSMEWIERMY